MLYFKRVLSIFVCVFLLTSSIPAQNKVPKKERYIYLWDVSGSLLSYKKNDSVNGPTIDEYTKQDITTTYSRANGLWMNLKDALIKSIDSIEVNAESEIIVIPFYSDTICKFKGKADDRGKEDIKDSVRYFKYPEKHKEHRTDLLKALSAFEDVVKSNCEEYINIMFFYTDGGHETKKDTVTGEDYGKVLDAIRKFTTYATAEGRYIYRYYYLVSKSADQFDSIKNTDGTIEHFWVIDNYTAIINLIYPDTNYLEFSIVDSSTIESSINIKKHSSKRPFSGKVKRDIENSDCYCVDVKVDMENMKLDIKVSPKLGVRLIDEEIKIKLSLEDVKGEYNSIINETIKIKCTNNLTPKLNIRLCDMDDKEIEIEDDDKSEYFNLGKSSYYKEHKGGFPFYSLFDKLEEYKDTIQFSIIPEFDEYAKLQGSKCNLSFRGKQSANYDGFKIIVGNTILSSSNDKILLNTITECIECKLVILDHAKELEFDGDIVISDIKDINSIKINDSSPSKKSGDDNELLFPIRLQHAICDNPYKSYESWARLGLIILLVLILVGLYIKICRLPRFPKKKACVALNFWCLNPDGTGQRFVSISDPNSGEEINVLNFESYANYLYKSRFNHAVKLVLWEYQRGEKRDRSIMSGNTNYLPVGFPGGIIPADCEIAIIPHLNNKTGNYIDFTIQIYLKDNFEKKLEFDVDEFNEEIVIDDSNQNIGLKEGYRLSIKRYYTQNKINNIKNNIL